MKYLLLLSVLLVGCCKSTHKFVVGDCYHESQGIFIVLKVGRYSYKTMHNGELYIMAFSSEDLVSQVDCEFVKGDK